MGKVFRGRVCTWSESCENDSRCGGQALHVHRFQEVGQSSLLCLWGGVGLEISSPAIEVPAPSLMQRAQSGALDVTLLPPTEQGMLTCLLTSSWVVSSPRLSF